MRRTPHRDPRPDRDDGQRGQYGAARGAAAQRPGGCRGPQLSERPAGKIDDLCAERKVLLDQKKLCEDGIEQYSHFTGLKVNVDDILDCAHVKIRFGFLPTEGYNKLMNNYGDDPYILFTPATRRRPVTGAST